LNVLILSLVSLPWMMLNWKGLCNVQSSCHRLSHSWQETRSQLLLLWLTWLRGVSVSGSDLILRVWVELAAWYSSQHYLSIRFMFVHIVLVQDKEVNKKVAVLLQAG
jgi:hypothetical protein